MWCTAIPRLTLMIQSRCGCRPRREPIGSEMYKGKPAPAPAMQHPASVHPSRPCMVPEGCCVCVGMCVQNQVWTLSGPVFSHMRAFRATPEPQHGLSRDLSPHVCVPSGRVPEDRRAGPYCTCSPGGQAPSCHLVDGDPNGQIPPYAVRGQQHRPQTPPGVWPMVRRHCGRA